MKPNELLVLNYDEFSERASKLYKRLDESAAFREVFVRNPAGVVSELLSPGVLRHQSSISRGNRLLFSLLSNEKFYELA